LRLPYNDKGNLYIESSSSTYRESLQKQIEEVEEGDSEFQKRLDADFERFAKVYPFDPSMDREAARAALGDLLLGDRDNAIAKVPAYVAALRAKKRSFVMDAVNYLRKRKFDEIADLQQEQAERAGLDKPLVFVVAGSEAFKAWDAAARSQGKTGYPAYAKHEGRAGWWFPTLWPPKPKPDGDVQF
jgi:hypothetical protein